MGVGGGWGITNTNLTDVIPKSKMSVAVRRKTQLFTIPPKIPNAIWLIAWTKTPGQFPEEHVIQMASHPLR